jgi:hypothetical protein
MPFELFSERRRRAERAGQVDVYRYVGVPQALKVQLHQIFDEAMGPYLPGLGRGRHQRFNNEGWELVHSTLIRELGMPYLTHPGEDHRRDVIGFLLTSDGESMVDVVELCCRYIDAILRPLGRAELDYRGIEIYPDDALKEVNYRFKRAGVGYQYESGQIIRIDTEYTHDEIVLPTLSLLSDARFKGSQDEFLEAHMHLRSGNAKDAVTWANKAFESTMKCACDIKGWEYPSGARASDLVKVLKRERLWPDYLDNSFDQLVSTLSSGLPQVRNNEGSHGQGAVPRETPSYVAAYAIHLAAAKILFIAEAALS